MAVKWVRHIKGRTLAEGVGEQGAEGDILSKTDRVKRNLKLSCGELHDWYCSPDIMRVIKLGLMRWAGHVACVEEKRGGYRMLVEKPEGKKEIGMH